MKERTIFEILGIPDSVKTDEDLIKWAAWTWFHNNWRELGADQAWKMLNRDKDGLVHLKELLATFSDDREFHQAGIIYLIPDSMIEAVSGKRLTYAGLTA